MKKILFALSLTALFTFQAGCAQSAEKQEGEKKVVSHTKVKSPLPVVKTTFKDISVDEFEELQSHNHGLVILDVRTPAEVAGGVVPGAVHINVNDPDFGAQVEKLGKDKHIAVYCKAGGRSKRAQNMMKDMGFTHVCNVQGGFDQWAASGKTVGKLAE